MLSLFLARTYLLKTAYSATISTMIYVCFIALFISSFSLALATAIMQGFERATERSMQGVHAAVMIRGFGQPLETMTIGTVLQKEFPEVIAVSEQTIRHAIIHNQQVHIDEPKVIILIGINPTKEADISSIQDKIVLSTEKKLEACLIDNAFLIGKDLAISLNKTLDDSLDLLFYNQDEPVNKKIHFNHTSVRVGGIFQTGIHEFDNNVAYCSIDFLNTLYPNAGPEQLNIKLSHESDESRVIERLKNRLELEVFSWKDFYPAIMAALKLEKYVSFIILSLITLVASMNILSLLFMYITHKKSDIALLKTMGCSDRTLISIFLWIGMIISTLAAISGLICAWGISWLLDTYKLIPLPDAYYVSHVPAHMDLSIFVQVLCIILIVSFCATWFPTRALRSIPLAHILRFEG